MMGLQLGQMFTDMYAIFGDIHGAVSSKTPNLGLGKTRKWEQLAESLDKISYVMANKLGPSSDRLVRNLIQWAGQLPKLRDQLQGINVSDLTAELQEIAATAIFAGNDSVKISGTDVRISINVKMSADQVAKAICKTKIFAQAKGK